MNFRIFKNFDFLLFLPIVLLTSYSFLVIYSTNPKEAKQQLIFMILGFLIYFLLLLFDYRHLRNLYFPLFAVLLIGLLVVLIFGPEIRGASRWIDLGRFRFQPAEFSKPALVVVLAGFFYKNWGGPLSFKTIAQSFLLVFFPVVLVSLQPDLGTALTFLVIWIGLIFISPVPLTYLLTLGLIFILSLPLVWQKLLSYQKERILTFFDPTRDPLGTGYNVLQAMIAVGSGKIFGRGFGRGPQSHLRFLPEHHTDFIFASLAEEWGFIGSLLLLGLFFLLILRIIMISQKSKEIFGFYLCLGAGFLLMFQVFINIGMNIGLMPITGIPLPLVSYGGSSLLGHMITLALVQNVAMRRRS